MVTIGLVGSDNFTFSKFHYITRPMTSRRFTSFACCMVFSLIFSQSIVAAEFVSITGDAVNVRSGPGTNYPIKMELFDGYPLKVVTTQGEWLQVVDFENDEGWVHNSLVTNDNTVIVNGENSVNMRAEPSTQSAVIASVDRGVVLTTLESRGSWLKVKHATGVIGWMYKPLLWP
jgi:SH3-like domain-containing protein